MGFSSDYPSVPDWVAKPEGYQTGAVVKYKGKIFRAAFWESEPGVGDAKVNGWRFFDELYDQTPHAPTQQAKVIAYIPTWRKKEGFNYGNGEMYQYITHGIIAFLTFSETNLGDFDPASVTEVTSVLPDVVTVGHQHGTKIVIALGGANDYGFLDLMTAVGNNPAAPQLDQAVRNVVTFVTTNSLDGVDLDLECWWGKPGEKDQGGRTKSDGPHPAGQALTLFAQKLKQAIPDKIVSATTFGTSWYGNNYDPGLANYVDWLGVMTYDLTGSWDQSPVGPHTALHAIRPQETSTIRAADVYQESYIPEQQGDWPGGGVDNNPILSVENSLWYWTNPLFVNWQGAGQGLPRNKIAVGVPIYGYDFSYPKDPDYVTGQVPPGYKSLRYRDILTAFPDGHRAPNANIQVPGTTPRPTLAHPLPAGDYPYTHNIYSETPDTAVAKLSFVKDIGAQGVIIWELSNDVWEDDRSIIKALYRASGNTQTIALPIKAPPLASPFFWDAAPRKDTPFQFKDDGVRPDRPGARQFSAQLWNRAGPAGGADGVAAAERSPAVIERQYFNRPTRINDLGRKGIWGEFDFRETGDIVHLRWGHMNGVEQEQPGTHRYLSELIVFRDGSGSAPSDWPALARQNPALIEGQYFDEPGDTGIDVAGAHVFHFDVSDRPSPLPAPEVQGQGPNGYCYCMCNNMDGVPQGNVTLVHWTSKMTVANGTPYLYAVLTTDDDSIDVPAGVVMTLVDPDGTRYDRELRTDSKAVVMAGESVRCLIVQNPKPGDTLMTMQLPPGAHGFRCECNTVPSAAVYETIENTVGASLEKRELLLDRFLPLAATSMIMEERNIGPSYIVVNGTGLDKIGRGAGPLTLEESQLALRNEAIFKVLNRAGRSTRARARFLASLAELGSLKLESGPVALVTWNMQGANWADEGPWFEVKRWFGGGGEGRPKVAVACLQECGSRPESAIGPFDCWVSGDGVSLGSYIWQIGIDFAFLLHYAWDVRGNRVNLAIISSTGWIGDPLYYPGPLRPLIGVILDGVAFFTIHASSGSRGDDAWELIQTVGDNSRVPWWVAGDFNREPTALADDLRANNINSAVICEPERATYSQMIPVRKLDYAVRNAGATVLTGLVPIGPNHLSDHFPVSYELTRRRKL